ncbi:MAG: KasA/KasB family beta-ketoacyl-ACP synthase, partial [Rhodococcus sp. (in: high G+C Gram-positive bacteria)]|uniref:KasA/KasB family beta-ketoacyl-ACP synthase n=1 Tax=Rhodococcus sp. TaxID=1831 RepID=UPI002AD7AEE8|nr:KasA/KasB family beta-ketoacyl-ACP synthase [Rhodococcus sp. (in: high G+C Gram-positive bacteria)]
MNTMSEPIATQTSPRNAVVTGYVATTALADDADATWTRLLDGQSGIGRLERDFVSEYDLPVRIGGVLQMATSDHLTRVEQRRLSFVEQLAVVLGRRLWRGSGLQEMDRDRLAVAVGTGLGGGDALIGAVDAMRAGGYRKVSPMSVPMVMPNGPAAHIGLEVGARAGVFTPVSACSSGSEAVAHAWRLVATGEADVVIAGGVEGHIDAVPIASFSMMRAMSTRNDEPVCASRPFDRDRDGFVFGEAGALLIIESEQHAEARGARIQGRLLGAGITSDGFHIVAPDPEGRGIRKAMEKAIGAAGLNARDVGHVNAHATATPIGDLSEAKAIAATVGHSSVYAPKSALGHSVGAVGAVEAILTLLSIRDSVVPPTLNLDNLDPAIDLDVVRSRRSQKIDYALSTSIGFGGHNVALALGRY